MSNYTITYGNIGLNTSTPSLSVGSGSSSTAIGISASPYVITTNGSNSWNTKLHGSELHLDEGADIKVGDKSLMKILESLEDRLGILTPNTELEKEFDELRECAQKYRELEKKFKEQKRVWDTLKKTDL